MTFSTLIEGRNSVFLTAPVSLISQDHEVAWEGARDFIQQRPDLAYLLSNYLTTSPMGNTNGHIFPLEDVRKRYKTIPHTPVNMGHKREWVVGACLASELVYPKAEMVDEIPEEERAFAHVETLSTFFRRAFPREYDRLEAAHNRGLSWVSMECVPDSFTCMTPGGCGQTFPYKGTVHESYCDELNVPRSKKIMNDPFFIGTGLILAPQRPGWRGADLTQIDALVKAHEHEAEAMYAAIETAATDDPAEGEIMAMLEDFLAGAFGFPPEVVRTATKLAAPATDASEDDIAVASLVAAETAAQTNGVIVAIVPPAEIAQVLADMGDQPVDQVHATVCFLGETNEEGTLFGHSLDSVFTALAAFCAGAPALGDVSISGLGRFALDNGGEVTYASLDAPALPEFRARLVAALDAAGIPVNREHGLSPHLTIRYHGPGQGPTEMPPEGLSWMVHHVELWWGDALHIPFELAEGKVAFAR